MFSNSGRSALSIITIMVSMVSSAASAQVRQVDVLITVVKDRIVALPGSGSPVEKPLGVNETIIATTAQGPAGLPRRPADCWAFLLAYGVGRRCSWASKSM